MLLSAGNKDTNLSVIKNSFQIYRKYIDRALGTTDAINQPMNGEFLLI